VLKSLLVLALVSASAVPALAASSHPLTPEQLYQRMCGNVLNLLPQIVPKRDIAAIPDDAHVVLHRICTGVDLNSFGNAAGLRKTIGANPALRRALANGGYNSDQVVGISISGNTVQLYVHRS
jgi:hypothetical protein